MQPKTLTDSDLQRYLMQFTPAVAFLATSIWNGELGMWAPYYAQMLIDTYFPADAAPNWVRCIKECEPEEEPEEEPADPATAYWSLCYNVLKWNQREAKEILQQYNGDLVKAFNAVKRQISTNGLVPS